MLSSGDVLSLWAALFSSERAWHCFPPSVPQAVSLGVASPRTQQRVDWFWGDKAKKGVAKLQSPSSNGGLVPFPPCLWGAAGLDITPCGVPQHLRLTAPLQCMPVTPTPLMGATGLSTIFTMPLAENEGHSKSTPWKDKYQSYLCWNVHYFMPVCGHAVPSPCPSPPCISAELPGIHEVLWPFLFPLTPSLWFSPCLLWGLASSYHVQPPYTPFPTPGSASSFSKITTWIFQATQHLQFVKWEGSLPKVCADRAALERVSAFQIICYS